MRDIINLLPKENMIKLKILGYQLLAIIVYIIGTIFSVGISQSNDAFAEVISIILLFGVAILTQGILTYFYVNGILSKNHDNFEISLGQSIIKMAAAFIIQYVIMVVFVLVSVFTLTFFLGLNSVVFTIVGVIIWLVILLQVSGVTLASFYAMLENVDRQKVGFTAVFKTYFKNILAIRKDCVKIMLACIIPVIILYICYIVALIVITMLSMAVLGKVSEVLLALVVIITLLAIAWLVLTATLYVLKKYDDLALKMND